MISFPKRSLEKILSAFALAVFIVQYSSAQTPKLTLDLTKPGANVSPMLYGLMTEEINHSYDGGLYAELIRNRIFKDNPSKPEAWSLVNEDTINSKASIKLMATTNMLTSYR
jgi:alpha-N-arabinofuranosidase